MVEPVSELPKEPNASASQPSKANFARPMSVTIIAGMEAPQLAIWRPVVITNAIAIVRQALMDRNAKRIRATPFSVFTEVIVPSSEAVNFAIALWDMLDSGARKRSLTILVEMFNVATEAFAKLFDPQTRKITILNVCVLQIEPASNAKGPICV